MISFLFTIHKMASTSSANVKEKSYPKRIRLPSEKAIEFLLREPFKILWNGSMMLTLQVIKKVTLTVKTVKRAPLEKRKIINNNYLIKILVMTMNSQRQMQQVLLFIKNQRLK